MKTDYDVYRRHINHIRMAFLMGVVVGGLGVFVLLEKIL